MNINILNAQELLNYAEPKTELEIALYERLKGAQEEIMDLQDYSGVPEL
jgi:hypothetical protein